MSVRAVTMYEVICDACGKGAHDFGENYVWPDQDAARHEAEENGFVQFGERDLCWQCWHICVTDPDEAAPGKTLDCAACQAAEVAP